MFSRSYSSVDSDFHDIIHWDSDFLHQNNLKQIEAYLL